MKINVVWLCIVGIVLSSCATLRRSEDLDVSLVGVQLADSTLLESTMNVTIRLTNRTGEPLMVNGGIHKIYLNGVYIGEGLNNQTLEIPRLSSVTQEVTTHLQNLRLVSRIRGILDSERLDYRIISVVYLNEGGRQPAIRAARAGTISLREFQPSRSQSQSE